uniref:Uncharacterized protein n=1 Tax=Rhizophora mucronata TaxID=61149 RepID=A0A2P2KSG3_RHIMU
MSPCAAMNLSKDLLGIGINAIKLIIWCPNLLFGMMMPCKDLLTVPHFGSRTCLLLSLCLDFGNFSWPQGLLEYLRISIALHLLTLIGILCQFLQIGRCMDLIILFIQMLCIHFHLILHMFLRTIPQAVIEQTSTSLKNGRVCPSG